MVPFVGQGSLANLGQENDSKSSTEMSVYYNKK
jgi:hypothetical protein